MVHWGARRKLVIRREEGTQKTDAVKRIPKRQEMHFRLLTHSEMPHPNKM
jgi:hypothetical protein